MKNYYEILRVSRDATLDEIKKVYRKLAMRYHPDRGGSENEEKFKEAKEAYENLSDPIKRAEHDKELLDALKEPQVAEPVVIPSVEEYKAPPPVPPKRQPPKVVMRKASPSAEDIMVVVLIASIVIFSALHFKNNKQSNISVAPVTITTTVVDGSREDPSMAEFYRILDARTDLGCKYTYPGVTGDPGEDPNVGCRGTPPVYRN